MQFLIDKTKAFFADEGGAAALEYGLLAALIAAVIALAVGGIGTHIYLHPGKTDHTGCLKRSADITLRGTGRSQPAFPQGVSLARRPRCSGL
jgi:Flp pilus assembly pilin Flp